MMKMPRAVLVTVKSVRSRLTGAATHGWEKENTRNYPESQETTLWSCPRLDLSWSDNATHAQENWVLTVHEKGIMAKMAGGHWYRWNTITVMRRFLKLHWCSVWSISLSTNGGMDWSPTLNNIRQALGMERAWTTCKVQRDAIFSHESRQGTCRSNRMSGIKHSQPWKIQRSSGAETI